MSGLDTSTAVIKGTWYSDDQSTFYVNDDGIDTQNDTFNGVAFSIPDEDLVSGLNTLTIVMTSDDLTDDGIRVEFSQATANSLSPVPEPNSILLLAGLALGIGWRSRCQRRKIN